MWEETPEEEIVAEPQVVRFSKGEKRESVKVSLQNPAKNKLIYKTNSTDETAFQVDPSVGSIDKESKIVLTIQKLKLPAVLNGHRILVQYVTIPSHVIDVQCSSDRFAIIVGFIKLLIKWRGGVYRLIYRELLVFILTYYAIAALYRHGLTTKQQKNFEDVALYCRSFSNFIPLTFVLGFYVSLIVTRWWNQYLSIPWVDKTCIKISALIDGNPEEKARLVRRTLARYLNLMTVLLLRMVSPAVRQRFPSLDHVEASGLMTQSEAKSLRKEKIMRCKVDGDAEANDFPKFTLPCLWFVTLLKQARRIGFIENNRDFQIILDEMMAYRSKLVMLFHYDWISVPLVYTQVVTIAVWSFAGLGLFGRQYLYSDETNGQPTMVDRYFPLLTFFQFFFYIGWLKVAEELINPLGCDDNDFEINYLIDRNLDMSLFMVDNMHMKLPELERDVFWDNPNKELPYTAAVSHTRLDPWMGSTMDLSIDSNEPFIDETFEPDTNPLHRLRNFTTIKNPRARKSSRIRSRSMGSTQDHHQRRAVSSCCANRMRVGSVSRNVTFIGDDSHQRSGETYGYDNPCIQELDVTMPTAITVPSLHTIAENGESFASLESSSKKTDKNSVGTDDDVYFEVRND